MATCIPSAKVFEAVLLVWICTATVIGTAAIVPGQPFGDSFSGSGSNDNSVNNKNIDAPNSVIFSLGKHDVYRDQITLSGFSSGGTFAQQLFVSYSSLFSGLASFSHAYYRCGPILGREADYDNACTIIGTNQSYNPQLALNDIRFYEQSGLIDSSANIRNKRLYVYAGYRSSFFSLDQSLGAVRVFEPLIGDPCLIKTRVQDAEQLFPTNKFGGSCSSPANGTLFLGNCGFSGAFESVNFLLKNNLKAPSETARPRLQQLLSFDQTEFFFGVSTPHSMDDIGYIYVPRNCYNQRCYLHFYFHGCLTGREFNGTDHIVNSGFLELAEANNLLVVFPQARSSRPQNMIGCWDTYGLTGRLYATQRGAQVSVVKNMMDRILGRDNAVIPLPLAIASENKPANSQFQIIRANEVFAT